MNTNSVEQPEAKVLPLDTTCRFIQIEGMDGSGKTSVIKRLATMIREWTGKDVVILRMPGGIVADEFTPPPVVDGGELVRDFFLKNRAAFDEDSALFLSLAAYRTHLVKTVRPVLDAGGYVLCDRGPATMSAYHNHLLNSNQVPAMTLVGHQDYLYRHQYPTVVYLDVSFEESMRRQHARTGSGEVIDSSCLDIVEKVKFEKIRRDMLRAMDSQSHLFSKCHIFSMEEIGHIKDLTHFLGDKLIPKVMPEVAEKYYYFDRRREESGGLIHERLGSSNGNGTERVLVKDLEPEVAIGLVGQAVIGSAPSIPSRLEVHADYKAPNVDIVKSLEASGVEFTRVTGVTRSTEGNLVVHSENVSIEGSIKPNDPVDETSFR